MGKNDPPPDDDDLPDDDDQGDGADDDDAGGGGDGGPTDASLTRRIEKVVRKVVADMLADSGDGGEGDDEGKPPAKPRTAAAVEDDMAARVRAALGEIQSEEDRENRMKKLEETVFAERPPVKQRRLERALWGSRSSE